MSDQVARLERLTEKGWGCVNTRHWFQSRQYAKECVQTVGGFINDGIPNDLTADHVRQVLKLVGWVGYKPDSDLLVRLNILKTDLMKEEE